LQNYGVINFVPFFGPPCTFSVHGTKNQQPWARAVNTGIKFGRPSSRAVNTARVKRPYYESTVPDNTRYWELPSVFDLG